MPEASDVGGDSAAPVKGCARRHGRGGAAVGHPEGHGAGQANALLRPTWPTLPPPPPRRYDVPLVADIHFQPKVAMLVAEAFEKIRINPGGWGRGGKRGWEVGEC